jgi:2-polyprenyl-3-methyl-5-hydroxy-6-metoxy-1,4-benzoquinol methylase
LLDGPLDPRTLAANLRDLARINRWFGGAGVSWRAIRPLLWERPPGRHMRLLDIGTGGADIPRALLREAAYRNPTLKVLATDVRPEIVALARELAGKSPTFDVRLAAPDLGDQEDGSFDVVHASLLLHHLEPPEAVVLLREMARVATRGVIINDLDRAWRWWAGAWLLTRLATANRYTRHDGPLSVRRAYRPDELAEMAAQAGLVEEARYRARPGYRYAIVFRTASRL